MYEIKYYPSPFDYGTPDDYYDAVEEYHKWQEEEEYWGDVKCDQMRDEELEEKWEKQ